MRSPAPRVSPGAKKKLPKFRLRSGISRGNFARFGHRSGTWRGDRWTTICSSAPHGGPPPRPPAFNWTLFGLAIRPSTALASHETVLGSAVPSPATPPAPCCFQIIRSGLQQVRFLRKLMPGEGFYMNVLWCIIKAWKRCAVPAAIASCCHESICAFIASRPALTRY